MQQRRALDTFKGSDWCRRLALWLGLCLLAAAGAGNLARAQPTLPAPNAALTNADEAIRVGDWKLLNNNVGDSKFRWQLYDLAEDISESNDLSQSRGDKLQQLKKIWSRLDGEMIPSH